jgi:ClpP class serine protease
MSPEQKALFEEDAKETHQWFINDVLAVRTMADVNDMQGQCWSGLKAAEKMLVTGIKDTLDDLLMYLGKEVYNAFESNEPAVGYMVHSESIHKFSQAETISLNAEVTPEQGKDDEDEKDAKPISEKKKKKKADGNEEDDEDDDEIGEKEIPDDPGIKPIVTDDKTK